MDNSVGDKAILRDGYAVKEGWKFSMCDERYSKNRCDRFRMDALEALYIAVNPGGGRIRTKEEIESQQRCTRMLNELAVELVGGVPESWEQFT